jgi:uncharacterized protein
VDSKTVIDAGRNGNEARFINHGCDPNCESAIMEKRVFIEAVRSIEPGEELAYDYQIQRDDDDAPDVDEIFACHCGAASCRGSMLEARKPPRVRKRQPRAAKSSKARSKTGRAGGKATARKHARRRGR